MRGHPFGGPAIFPGNVSLGVPGAARMLVQFAFAWSRPGVLVRTGPPAWYGRACLPCVLGVRSLQSLTPGKRMTWCAPAGGAA